MHHIVDQVACARAILFLLRTAPGDLFYRVADALSVAGTPETAWIKNHPPPPPSSPYLPGTQFPPGGLPPSDSSPRRGGGGGWDTTANQPLTGAYLQNLWPVSCLL